MKVESRIFEILTVFFFVAGIVYAVLAQEAVGIAGLFLTGGLSLIVGTYFRFISRRLEARPEDNPDGEISDGAIVAPKRFPGFLGQVPVAVECVGVAGIEFTDLAIRHVVAVRVEQPDWARADTLASDRAEF